MGAQEPLEDKTLTVCYGSDFVNPNFVNFCCSNKETAEVRGSLHGATCGCTAYMYVTQCAHMCFSLDVGQWSAATGLQLGSVEWAHFDVFIESAHTTYSYGRQSWEDSCQEVSDIYIFFFVVTQPLCFAAFIRHLPRTKKTERGLKRLWRLLGCSQEKYKNFLRLLIFFLHTHVISLYIFFRMILYQSLNSNMKTFLLCTRIWLRGVKWRPSSTHCKFQFDYLYIIFTASFC